MALINLRHSDSVVMPLGILYVAAVLEEAGHQVQVFDPFFEDLSFIEKIKNFRPHLVGLSILTATYDSAKKVAQVFRQELPQVLLCAGGPHPTALPEKTLKELDLDFLVYGEGEYTLREVCEKLSDGKGLRGVKGLVYKSGQRIVKNPPRELIENLDELPFPARHLLDAENYLIPPGYIRSHLLARTLTVYATRGCPSHCTFCSSHLLFGRRNRRRSVKNVLAELKLIKKKYQLEGVYFMDDTLTLDQKWMMAFCRQKIKEKINLVWGCQTRVSTVNETLLRAMKEAGCLQVDFGVESGSEKVLKGLKKGQTPKMIKRAFKLAQKVGLRTFATLIVGSPGEEEEDVEKSERLIKEIAPHYTHICFCTPLPGTELYEQAIKEGWINPAFGNRWDFVKNDSPVMSAHFSPKELVSVRARLDNVFFWQNYRYVFYPRNLPFLFGAARSVLLDPKGLFQALRQFLKTKNADELVHFVLYAYRRQKIAKRL